VYPVPDYQKSAVATYIQDHNPSYPSYKTLAPNTSDVTQHIDIDALAGAEEGFITALGVAFQILLLLVTMLV